MNGPMDTNAIKFINKVGTKLPSLPTIYQEITAAVDKQDSSISDIGAIVGKDQSLASRLLKLANSAMYSFPSQIETIEEALQLIGLREMRDLALATTVISTFNKLPQSLVNPIDFWKHSIACGTAAAMIAERRFDPAPERFLIGGLMHDIGRLIMYLFAAKESTEILSKYDRENTTACRIEHQVLGFDHCALGAELLAIWKLPSKLVELVRLHHNPSKIATPTDDGTVHCADFLITAMGIGNSGESVVQPLSEEAYKNCLIEDASLEEIANTTERRCEEIFAILVK
jgi:putative nucleotidyltransferase with HDIG domain